MYNPQYTSDFYNAYGFAEWSRLEATAYGRLQAIIHTDFIQRYVKPGDRVLDAGSGPGRFAIEIARVGATVTVLDISGGQLELARQKIAEAGLTDYVKQYIEADISDLSLFPGGCFDCVVCYGGALSYVCENRFKASAELMRVTRQDGTILISVMSKLGSILGLTRQPDILSLKEPDKGTYAGFWQVLERGDLPGFPSRKAKMVHAPMHLYTADELQTLFKDCRMLETAGSNVTVAERGESVEKIAADAQAWQTLVELERKLDSNPGLVNCGSHIILVAQK